MGISSMHMVWGLLHSVDSLGRYFQKRVAAVYADLAECEPKSCVHEYNYVVRLLISL